jgi:hypothetical protein
VAQSSAERIWNLNYDLAVSYFPPTYEKGVCGVNAGNGREIYVIVDIRHISHIRDMAVP